MLDGRCGVCNQRVIDWADNAGTEARVLCKGCAPRPTPGYGVGVGYTGLVGKLLVAFDPLCTQAANAIKALQAEVKAHEVQAAPARKTEAELAALLAAPFAAREVAGQSRWRHYRGGLYFVLCRSLQESTLEVQVTYQPWNSSLRFTRPLAEWTELVEHEGQRVPRFVEAD